MIANTIPAAVIDKEKSTTQVGQFSEPVYLSSAIKLHTKDSFVLEVLCVSSKYHCQSPIVS